MSLLSVFNSVSITLSWDRVDFALWTLDVEPVMFLKVLIAPDKFKGTLTAQAAAQAIARGWRQARPEDELHRVPITDGGDGFGAVMSGLLEARAMKCKTVDAAHRFCRATWWWNAKAKIAVIESANIIGLAKLPPGKFHPFHLDTLGLGKVIQAAHARGAKKILIGIGGSATNDGGFGLARALGWKFLNIENREIGEWTQLAQIHKIEPPHPQTSTDIIVAVDVQNQLLGPHGATRVYGPQKGLRPPDFRLAESCLKKLTQFVRGAGQAALVPGTGAAGGLGFGLLMFAGAKLKPGFDLFAQYADLDARLPAADIVITGEGAIDRSTFMGKGVGEIARRSRKLKIPCIALGGTVEARLSAKGFLRSFALSDLTSVRKAKLYPALWLARLAAKAAREMLSPKGLHRPL